MFKNNNYEERAAGKTPYIILLHYTGMSIAEDARLRLTDPKSKVSAHYLVDDIGTVYNLVDEDKRAWHAGIAYWKRESDINSVSIGIEIVNPGHEFGYRPFPDEQMYAVRCLCQEIQARHDIKYVLGHSDVAPERKIDPGELFDWEYLAREGVGVWPVVIDADHLKAENLARSDFESKKLFDLFGYNPIAAHVDVITAFQRHYFPEVFQGNREGQPGVACVETMARLVALSRLNKKVLV
jgi:N-acetylmuramoyl-L-alanine amidase